MEGSGCGTRHQSRARRPKRRLINPYCYREIFQLLIVLDIIAMLRSIPQAFENRNTGYSNRYSCKMGAVFHMWGSRLACKSVARVFDGHSQRCKSNSWAVFDTVVFQTSVLKISQVRANLPCDQSALRLPRALHGCHHKNSHRPIQAPFVTLSILDFNVSLFLDDRIDADNVLDVAHRLNPNVSLDPETLH